MRVSNLIILIVSIYKKKIFSFYAIQLFFRSGGFFSIFHLMPFLNILPIVGQNSKYKTRNKCRQSEFVRMKN